MNVGKFASMKFSDIPSHNGIKERLRTMVETSRLPHALLLEGRPGCYKLALARAMAQYIHCTSPTPHGDSCGHCPSCLQHSSLNHIDTLYVYPVVKSDSERHPVSDTFADLWKEFLSLSPEADSDMWTAMLDKKNARPTIYVDESDSLIHKLSFTAHSARMRVIIFWLPERANEECANKLLKLVEEPFPDTLFIFVSNDSKSILPTIYSRTQRIEVPRLPDAEIEKTLILRHGVAPDEAHALAHIADGDIVKAIRLTETAAGGTAMRLDKFISLMRLAYQRQVGALRQWGNDLAGEGRDIEVKFYNYASRLVRENFIYNFGVAALNYMTPPEGKFSGNFARFITEANAEPLCALFDKAAHDISANANGKIVNFDVALKVCFLLKHQ